MKPNNQDDSGMEWIVHQAELPLPRSGIEWAAQQWEKQVKHRPLRNVHRSALDSVWRQVIRYFGGDDQALCGPTHSELIAANNPMTTADLDRLEREIVGTLGSPNLRSIGKRRSEG